MKILLALILLAPGLLFGQMLVPNQTEQLFKEYYGDEPRSEPPRRETKPVPTTRPKPPQPRTEADQSTKPPKPPRGYTLFGYEVNFFGGVRLGRVDQRRKVRVESKRLNPQEEITRKDNGALIGYTDGTTHSYTENNSYDRLELQLGINHENKSGGYTRFQFHSSEDINEFTLIRGLRHFTDFPIDPYIEGMLLIGYNEATDLLPTDYGLGMEVGLLYPLTHKLFLEAGIGYKFRRWRPVDKDYGQEYWDDRDIQSQIGLRYHL